MARFPTTQWSRVILAGDPVDPEGRVALEGLCEDYWYPIYAFVRRKGLDRDEASDLVQGLFTDLIERCDFAKADPARGRFRSFLRAVCEHFLAHHREHDRALKRGGGKRLVSLDAQDAEGRYINEPSHELTPERLFERRWATVLLSRVLVLLEAEAIHAGKSSLFACLRPTLEGEDLAHSYQAIGETLGMTAGAVKIAAHRFRGRYRQLLREEVARTVADPVEVDAEIADLLRVLA
jgi:DNA-directed RNA polymerase specialized sigma24 family protein